MLYDLEVFPEIILNHSTIVIYYINKTIYEKLSLFVGLYSDMTMTCYNYDAIVTNDCARLSGQDYLNTPEVLDLFIRIHTMRGATLDTTMYTTYRLE